MKDTLTLARQDFAAFCSLVYSGFKLPAHIEMIVSLLERMERGDLPRVLLSLPPRHGKTTTACHLWPAWIFGRDPRRHIIFATHSAEYASTVGRKVRNLMMSERYLAAFPKARLSDDSTAADRFDLEAGGSYLAVGRGVSAMGRGADFAILDDVVKGIEEARSPATRQATKAWYSADIHSRLEPGARLLSVGTRWSLDDLPAYLEREHPHEEWRVVNLPALAEEDDPLGREPGEALWPARYPAVRLKLIRLSKSAAEWSSLYMGKPTPEGGAVFLEEWLGQRFDFETFSGAGKIVQSWDCSVGKSATSGDYSACVTVASGEKGGFYVLDCVVGRWPYPELRDRVRALAAQWNPHEVLIEDSSSGSPIIQELRRDGGLPPIQAVPAVKEKTLRWELVSPQFREGRVFFRRDAAWLPGLIEELIAAPGGAHDDQVDALTQAIEHLRSTGVPESYTTWMDYTNRVIARQQGGDPKDDPFHAAMVAKVKAGLRAEIAAEKAAEKAKAEKLEAEKKAADATPGWTAAKVAKVK